MQKYDKKASILLWTIFLSVIISIAFIGVSTKINKKLQNNSNSIEEKNISNDISNKLLQKDFTSKIYPNGLSLYFEESNYFNTSLVKDKSIVIGINTGAIEINIENGGPIYYTINELPSGVIDSSGIIEKNDILNGVSGNITIKNLGGSTHFSLKAENNLNIKKQKYRIIQTIGNKEVLKTSGSIAK